MGSGVEPYSNAGESIEMVVLATDLMLGDLDGARRREPWTLLSALLRDRLRGDEVELPDDSGEMGRSISLRRLSLATLNADVELRGFASSP